MQKEFKFEFEIKKWVIKAAFLFFTAFWVSLGIFYATGCTTSPTGVAPSPAPSTIISEPYKPDQGPLPQPIKGWPQAYTDFIFTQVPLSLLQVKKIDFCPNYGSMSEADKRQTWAMILKGIAKPESGWNRTTQYTEKTMGLSSVTGETIVSEGLLQLSYSDGKNYKTPACSSFNWVADKNEKLENRSITNAYANLGCGLEISERLMRLHNEKSGAVYALGRYWSTMRRGKCVARKFIRENTKCGMEKDGC